MYLKNVYINFNEIIFSLVIYNIKNVIEFILLLFDFFLIFKL